MPTITVNDRLSEAVLDAAEGDTGGVSFRTIEDHLDWLENHRKLPESSADDAGKRRQEDKPK